MAKIHRSTGQRISPLAATRRKNRSLWDQLELLIVPGVLVAGVFFVHDQLAQKQKSNGAASSAEQTILSAQRSNQSAQTSLNSDLPEGELIDGEQIQPPTSTDQEFSWLDRPIRGQLSKSLRRADLIHSNEKIESFNEINSSGEINLSGVKSAKAVFPSLELEAVLLKKLFSTSDQQLPRGLFIDNHTIVSLSGIDLFGNPLTSSDLFESKLIKADFRGASFSKTNTMDLGFPNVSLFGTAPLTTALLTIELNKTDILSVSTSVRHSETKLINTESLGSNFSRINLIDAGFGTAIIDNTPSNPENQSTPNSSSDDFTKQQPRPEALGVNDFSKPSQIQSNPSKTGLNEDLSISPDQGQ